MTQPDNREPSRKPESDPPAHPAWDRKQGTPKDSQTARHVERSSGRYSASEQSEEKSRSSAKK